MKRTCSTLAVALLTGVGLGAAANGPNRLIDAVKDGNREAVRALITQRALVNTAEPDGTTALHWAARASDLETVQLLLRAGANASTANRNGVTPLSVASLNGDAPMIGALLTAGADPNALLPGGQTVLMTAARTGNADAVKLLTEHGAEVNARESLAGETAVMWAAAENHPGAIKVLAAHGADVNGRSNPGSFPRDRFGDGIVALQTFLPRGNWTPSMYAARQNAADAVRALADAGADLNATDPDGTTALILAVNNAHFDTAAALLEKGADPNVGDITGMTALHALVEVNTLGFVPGRPALKPTGRLAAVDLGKLLLARGADPNAAQKRPILNRHHSGSDATLGAGATPLMRAAKRVDLPLIHLLLESGADAKRATAAGTTVLMFAVGAAGGRGGRGGGVDPDKIAAIMLCLAKGIDINAVNDAGQTALHVAVQAGDEIVRLLAEHGAKLDITDKQGHTPLDLALGAGGRGRGGPAPVRESTAALLRQLSGGGPGTAQTTPAR